MQQQQEQQARGHDFKGPPIAGIIMALGGGAAFILSRGQQLCMSAAPFVPMGIAAAAGVGIFMVGRKLTQMQAESRAEQKRNREAQAWTSIGLRAALKAKFAEALEAHRAGLAICMAHAPQRTINYTSELVVCDLRARADEFAAVLVIPQGEADLAGLASIVLRETMTAKVQEWGSSSRWIYRLEERMQLECQKLATSLVLAVEEAVAEVVAQHMLGNMGA